jgi:hypothetical protein
MRVRVLAVISNFRSDISAHFLARFFAPTIAFLNDASFLSCGSYLLFRLVWNTIKKWPFFPPARGTLVNLE